MRKLGFLFFAAFLIQTNGFAQEVNAAEAPTSKEKLAVSYIPVGAPVSAEAALGAAEMSGKYENLAIGDTIAVKFKAEVASVCKKKGCWMNLKLANGKEAAVKFKDYAFFVPKDIEEKEVIVEGKAFVSVVSVEEQRHYAEDAGKTKEEVMAITAPKKTLGFMADGVLIKE